MDNKTKQISSVIKNNLYDLFEDIGRAYENGLHLGRKISWVSATPFSWPHYVFRTDMSDSRPARTLLALKKAAGRGRVPDTLLVPEDFADRELLHQLGIFRSGKWAGMAYDLDGLPESMPVFEGAEVKTVIGEEAFSLWLQLAEDALFGGERLDRGLFENLGRTGRATYFLGYKHNLPVATSMLYVSSGVAGIYCVSTTKPHRRNGVGRAVTLAPMFKAQKMGCRLCVLQATPMGEPVYRKIGFKHYGSLGKFILTLPGTAQPS